MKVSIITATFNSEKNIVNCLQSVANQNYSDIEHIVIDGGSTDNTLEIINSCKTVSRIISEPDKGIYDALNKGLKLATGDVVGFLHSDDFLISNTILKDIIKVFREESDIDGVYGNLVFVDSQNPDKIVRTWKSKPFTRKNVKYGWMPPHPTLFLRREVYKKHGFFDISFKIAGDYNFMLKVMLDNCIKLRYLPKVIIKMRMGGVSTGTVGSIIQKSREDIRALQNNGFKMPIAVLFAKNFRKLPQLLLRKMSGSKE